MNLDEEQATSTLRTLTVSEWQGERRNHYERFIVTDNFDEEVEKFKQMGHFASDLGNLMVLAMSNVLKMPIVIFSSLENFPTIPVLPREQLSGTPPLFVSYNAAGCGHYDFVKMEPDEPAQEPRELDQGRDDGEDLP